MPKRSAEEKIKRYNTKIRKLQYKTEKIRRKRVVYSSQSDSEKDSENETRPMSVKCGARNEAPRTPLKIIQLSLSPIRSPSPSPSLLVAEPPSQIPLGPDKLIQNIQSSPSAPALADQDNIRELSPELDPELLEALGETVVDVAAYGPNIHNKLAQRWLPILKKGLPAEIKEKLLKEYLIPDNCKLLKAPTLNPEIAAAINDLAKNRDKKIQIKQDQLGIGISALNKAMTLLLTGEDKIQALKILSDGCRILTDLHFNETNSRNKLITPGLDKSLCNILQGHERDETLFGNSLSEKIKAAKAIEKQGQQIKKLGPTKTTSTSGTINPVHRPRGNWPGPPRYQHQFGRGGRTAPQRNYYRRGPTQQQGAARSTQAPSTRHVASTAAANKRAPNQ